MEQQFGIIIVVRTFENCPKKKLNETIFNLRSLDGGGGGDQIDTPSIFLAINFSSLTDCPKALAQLLIVCEHIF